MALSSSSSSQEFDQLQSRFQSSLTSIGYTGAVGLLPPNLSQNKKLLNFVKAVTDKLNRDHFLSPQEITKYEELKSAGAVLEGELLQQAVTRLSGTVGRSQSSLESTASEVEELKLRIASAKSQLSTLTAIKSKLSDHYASLAHEKDELSSQRTLCQRHLQVAMETADHDNTQLNTAAQELELSIQSVCRFHRGEEERSKSMPRFLSQLSQEPYHTSESQYLAELTAYSKKQFFEGIASMTAATAGVEDSQCADLDLGDKGQVLLRGLTQEQYEANSQELARLQAVYPVTEMKYLNAKMAEQYAVSAASKAKEELSAMQKPGQDNPDTATLRKQITVKENQLSGLQSQISEVGSTILPALLEEMATLKVTAVLYGDHDLKLARQEYFTSKQRKVIHSLQSQRARHELLSMLCEVELGRHRETHRLFSATKKQLMEWKTHRERRIHGLKSPTLLAASRPRKTIDSDDVFAQSVCTLVGVTQSPEAPFITVDSLKAALKQLAQRIASAESVLLAKSTEQANIVKEQEQLLRRYDYTLGGDNDKPALTIGEYQAECDQLNSVVTSMEKNIKSLLKQFEGHKKTINADSALTTERQLFIYFFTDTNKLRSVVGELGKRIDTTATLQSSMS